jgi:hypothetical protein
MMRTLQHCVCILLCFYSSINTLHAQRIGFQAGGMHSWYSGAHDESSGYSAAKGRILNPSFGISIADWRNRNKNTGLNLTYQTLKDYITEGYEHHSCGFRSSTWINRHNINVQFDFLQLNNSERRCAWQLGLRIPIRLANKTSGNYHDFCGIPQYYKDTSYSYSKDQNQLNRSMGFGLTGSFRLNLVQRESWKLGLRGVAYAGIISDYSAYNRLTPFRLSLEGYASWQFLSDQALKEHDFALKKAMIQRRRNRAMRKAGNQSFSEPGPPLRILK